MSELITQQPTLLSVVDLQPVDGEADLSLQREVNLFRSLTAAALTANQMRHVADCLLQLAKIQKQQNKLMTLSGNCLRKTVIRDLAKRIIEITAQHYHGDLTELERSFENAIDQETNRPEDYD